MKFERLTISNLRAIRLFEIENLGSFVVLAGQNGSGKSCVLDAIRLLKSVYGGYAANEYHQWFGEFAVNLSDPQSLQKLFRDTTRSIRIEGAISFADDEVAYLKQHSKRLVQPIAWQEVTGQSVDLWSFSQTAYATQLRQYRPQLMAAVERLESEISIIAKGQVHTLAIEITPSGQIGINDCTPAEVAFQAYEPSHLGVIDYHSASRSYSRQQVGGVNLDARAFEDQQRQQRLYNWQNKYQNIKTELATSYLRNLIAKESGSSAASDDLNSTLAELFKTFFPDKTYGGVQPQLGGSLEFPVQLATGERHDIDELSSGEKEILYGYLKLKNSTPRQSVILIDEPELHLNPSLLQGFTDFYYRHLGVAQGNQLWLVTHSDALLRQAVGNANYGVYHMVAAAALQEAENQAVEVVADDDVERVTIELVGELAAYRPHGKVVILEGRSEDGFDANMVRRLFPDFARRVNLVSGGSKQRVSDLYEALQATALQAGIRNRFFVVTDKDRTTAAKPETPASRFIWDVYHIENYLLEPQCIRAAVQTLLGSDVFGSDEAVLGELRDCAGALVDRLVLEHLRTEVDRRLFEAIRIGATPSTTSPADDILPALQASLQRIELIGAEYSIEGLRSRAEAHRAGLRAAIEDESWRSEFPGRDIIRRFVDRNLRSKANATIFTNVVLDKMVEHGIQPSSMKRVLDNIATQ